MENIILYDLPKVQANLLPISFTRPIADFRVGITTIREKWERVLPGEYSYLVPDYLKAKFVAKYAEENLFLASHIMPDESLTDEIKRLKSGEALYQGEIFIAFRGSVEMFESESYAKKDYAKDIVAVNYLYEIFTLNGQALTTDFDIITKGRTGQTISDTNIIIGDASKIFIEDGASVEGAFLNVTKGPIYIGRDAEIMEGSCVRGPFSLGENSHVNMGTKIYSDTTIGPWCKVGGELNNAVFFGYSNKAHDGFVGNAVIGEWCNIGAGTNASNLKNDYSKIRLWNYPGHTFMRTDLQFCGLIMGDHSKVGINCMFNTATVLGVGVNIHGAGFPRTFIPSFSEGSPTGGFTDVQLKKFFEIAGRAMARRGKSLTEIDYKIFEEIYQVASQYK